jgi:hypothetical protein
MLPAYSAERNAEYLLAETNKSRIASRGAYVGEKHTELLLTI